jgi:hypothetical protein
MPKKTKQPRKGNIFKDFVICESVRQEAHGKHTLVGVYGDDIIFKSWPAQEDKKVGITLSFFIRFESDATNKSVSVRFLDPSKTELLTSGLELSDAHPRRLITLVIAGESPLLLTGEGEYSFELDYAGKRDVRYVTVRVDPGVS